MNTPLADVTKSFKVRIGKQIIGRIDVVELKNGYKDHRAFIACPELEFRQVGVATTFDGALDLIGNAILHKLWEVK